MMNKTAHKILIVCLSAFMLLGCESDAEKRVRYKKIADDKYPWAGKSGVGLVAHDKSDYSFAYKEWKPLAEKGDPEAQNFVGNLYLGGQHVRKDHKEAMKWYHKAANQGHGGAMFTIGSIYELGQGVNPDVDEGVRWYKMAAAKGHGTAMGRLGDIYDSIADPRAEVQAYMWYDIASKYAEFPFFPPKQHDRIARRMTAAQIEEAKKLIKAWEAKYGKKLKKYR